jgi:hypothetical protein
MSINRAVAFTVALLLLLAPPAAAVHEKGPPPKFCEHGLVRDYRAPLRELPELHGAPEYRRLPFGPSGVFLHAPADLRERGGFVAYTLEREGLRPVRLDWDLTASLSRVGAQGRMLGRQRVRLYRVGLLAEDRRFGFRIPATLGLYRFDVAIRDFSGRLLSRYGAYIRLIERRRDVRVALSAASVRPGETVSARVENHGSGSLILSGHYWIEAFDGSTWNIAPISPRTPDPLVGLATGPGGALTCWRFPVPSDAPPGRYRLVGEIEHSWSWPKAPLTGIPLAPEFEILPAS